MSSIERTAPPQIDLFAACKKHHHNDLINIASFNHQEAAISECKLSSTRHVSYGWSEFSATDELEEKHQRKQEESLTFDSSRMKSNFGYDHSYFSARISSLHYSGAILACAQVSRWQSQQLSTNMTTNAAIATRARQPLTATLQQQQKSEKKKKVHFSDILEIRRLPVTLGDHPCCREGMALTCTWPGEASDDISNYLSEVIDLNTYEDLSQKRRMADLRLDYATRKQRLEELTGLTSDQLLMKEYQQHISRRKEQRVDGTTLQHAQHSLPRMTSLQRMEVTFFPD